MLPIDEVSNSVEFATSLSRLDTLDLEEVFHHRALLMKSPPAFLNGAYRSAMRLALVNWTRRGQSRSNAFHPGVEVVPSVATTSSLSSSSTTRRIGSERSPPREV